MKYALLILLLNLLLAAPILAEGKNAPGHIQVGEFSVYPILDRQSVMKAELFSGPLSQEERLRFMPGGQAPASVNIFLIKSPRGNYLIDCGWGGAIKGEDLLPARLKEAGVAFEDIDLVFLTHMHPDHIGGLMQGAGAVMPKAKIWVDETELAHWLYGPKADAGKGIQARLAEAYDGRILLFKPDQEIVPGLTAVKAEGHTLGHTVFSLFSQGQEMLFVGDIIHAAALRFPNPYECAEYDDDRAKAVESRRRVLDLAAKGDLLIGGAHIPYPGLGRVAEEGQGYAFTPAPHSEFAE